MLLYLAGYIYYICHKKSSSVSLYHTTPWYILLSLKVQCRLLFCLQSTLMPCPSIHIAGSLFVVIFFYSFLNRIMFGSLKNRKQYMSYFIMYHFTNNSIIHSVHTLWIRISHTNNFFLTIFTFSFGPFWWLLPSCIISV